MKDEKQTKIYEAGEYLPEGLETLFPEGKDKIRIIIQKLHMNDVDENVILWIDDKEYISTSKYVLDTLKYLIKKDIGFPFGITLIRKESKAGNIYFDLRP